ncbi:hypothetical protein HMPREF1981_01623 [Bacteroides pyogenes F0041]|uniref:DUF4332 domain-containing protein n=1 Tax=Bacteroides pyogenes F0041 TaxID=1321819 RepID=U2CLX5_9BACE|nr:DUF4332 domain-containing protein [Bacteroides pyogenes]ERI85550.1 hypothetical protein HMPREF1981_01623 [Bacteroides pyogenes F0041]MBB3893931.1 putative flap endonuclease-1-like 5' DNA nuclease [Bacteroides pyogenes]GAE23399.1 hypothetical protein JCM10003_3158 [Bacteroides pyogenes JCM 10003]SUV34057.1 TfoX C-terminal domain [Bacteroides pyogenes]
MAHKIEQIEGIGEVYAQKLNALGIKTTEDLLQKGATASGRAKLAEETGISGKLILKWTNHADLFRIKGIAGQFAELLEAAGVDTVKEFRHRVPANLHAKLVETNEAKNLCNRVPAVSELEKMIAQAKELDPVITY